MKTVALRTVLDQYLERRTDVKEITKIKWRQTCNALKEFFGADKPLASITVGEARDFERGLPLAALEVCEGRDESPVTITVRPDDAVELGWNDHGVPRSSEQIQPKPKAEVFPA